MNILSSINTYLQRVKRFFSSLLHLSLLPSPFSLNTSPLSLNTSPLTLNTSPLTLLHLTLITYHLTLLTSCSSIECPLETTVETRYAVPDTLKDTLWVWTPRADGQDTLLLNRGVNLTQFALPLSYQHPEDTLIFYIADTLHHWTIDTVYLKKDDYPHFESVDCNTQFFHRLTAVRSTGHAIDSITIVNPSVTYDQTATHINIRFKPRQ